MKIIIDKKLFFKNGGVVTIELLIAFAILIINMTGIILLSNANQMASLDNEINTKALYMADTALGIAKYNAKFDFNLLNSFTKNDGFYTTNLEVTQPSENFFLKRIKSVVTWSTAFSQENKVELLSEISNLEAVRGGDTCSSVLIGDWTNPQKSGYEFGVDIINDTSSTFPITSIQAFNGIMYVGTGNSLNSNTNNFFRIDISNPSEPTFTPPGLDNNEAVNSGINAIAIDGKNYAYIASAHSANFNTCQNSDGLNKSCGQLQVIDLNTFSVVYTYKVPNVTGLAGQAIGVSLFYKDGIIFLGLAKATGPEMNIIDVGGGDNILASPTNPILISSYEINNEVNDMYLRNNYLYVASPNDQELKIFDVSDLENPILVGGFDAPAGGANNGNGKSFHLIGNTLYFGRTLLTGDEFYILDVTNPENNLPILGSRNIQNGNINASVNKIITRDYLSMLVTNKEFQILRTDDHHNISPYTSPISLPPQAGVGMQAFSADCEGNYVFIGSQGPDNVGFLTVITAN
jgi:hypothetical protein